MGPDWDQAFLDDRKALFPDVDFDSLDRDVEHAMAQLRASAALLDAQLADGRAFLTGDKPGLADIQAFGVPWFTRAAMSVTEKLLGHFSRLPAWEARVAELGDGQRERITAAAAHDEARSIEPDLAADVDVDDPQNLRIGSRVTVEADDFSARGAVAGEVLRVSPLEITVHRRTDAFGDLLVHFPRLGYRVTPLA